MTLDIKVTTKGMSPKASKSDIRRMLAVTLLGIAKAWHKRYSADKFTAKGARKYHYAVRRTKNILTGKIRTHGKFKRPLKFPAPSGLPLVWSGTSRSLAKSSTTFKANSKRSRAVAPLRALNFRPGGINLRAEYTLVLPSEERQIGKDGEKVLRSFFSRGKRNATVSTS